MAYHNAMDYSDWYRKASAPFRGNAGERALPALDRTLVYMVAAAYIATLAFLALNSDARFWKALLVPAATFAITSIIRNAIDAPRPYERFGIDPLIEKGTKGKTMPSRHMTSATIIACTLGWLCWPAGIIGAVVCTLIAFTRIIGGVHFPRDIIAAVITALLCALLGFLVVP